jgi:hypothetical protein
MEERMKRIRRSLALSAFAGAVLLVGCATSKPASADSSMSAMQDKGMAHDTMSGAMTMAKDPKTAPQAAIDRFSAKAGTLQVRTAANGLPGPNQPIDFDKGPFITTGLGPDGEVVRYYNFDVQPTSPAPIYVLFRSGENKPVEGQLNIVDVIPGDKGYSDFWEVNKVTVPTDYKANTLTSLAEIQKAGYPIRATSNLVNCPIVPDGSTARLRLDGENAGLQSGWYRGEVVHYFTFAEHALTATAAGKVPVSPIYVAFNVNPGQPNGGPASGFRTQMGSAQTHNVVATLPSDMGYSPLWSVSPYDDADFASVHDLASALAARVLDTGVATVNCPIVSIENRMNGMKSMSSSMKGGM